MDANAVTHVIAISIGWALIAVALLDVFLTVLYARISSGFISHHLACLMWRIFRTIAKPFTLKHNRILSLCGPCILVTLVSFWIIALATGSALIIWPALGNSIRCSHDNGSTDFATAFYIAAGYLTTAGGSEYFPRTTFYRLFLSFDAAIGISVLTLTITYLLEIYNALQKRNAFGLKLHLLTASTGDAADLVAGLGPDGRFDIGYSHLMDIGIEMIEFKESHHFYSAIFYFRFRDAHYALSRIALISLDSVTLIRSALDDDAYGWLKKSAATEQLWRSSMQLLTLLAKAFLPGGLDQHTNQSDLTIQKSWDDRYHAAIAKFRLAGIITFSDERKGAQIYASSRIRWDHYIRAFAQHMEHSPDTIDRAMFSDSVSITDFDQRLRTSS